VASSFDVAFDGAVAVADPVDGVVVVESVVCADAAVNGLKAATASAPPLIERTATPLARSLLNFIEDSFGFGLGEWPCASPSVSAVSAAVYEGKSPVSKRGLNVRTAGEHYLSRSGSSDIGREPQRHGVPAVNVGEEHPGGVHARLGVDDGGLVPGDVSDDDLSAWFFVVLSGAVALVTVGVLAHRQGRQAHFVARDAGVASRATLP
jgi:hypothetical protein